jgi:hypothetical protein
MLARNPISEATRARQRAKQKLRAALARLHKHRERKKQGPTVFRFWRGRNNSTSRTAVVRAAFVYVTPEMNPSASIPGVHATIIPNRNH